jgi:hypothetical protein
MDGAALHLYFATFIDTFCPRLLRFDRFNPRTFDRSVPLLDVAERHDLESLRTAMLGCLESDCPQSLADWDALTNSITTSSMTVTRTGGFLDDLVLEPVLAISRARRFGLYSLLPPLFAMLAQFSERWHWDDHFSTAAAALPSYHPSRWHIRHRGARWDLLDDEDVQHLGGVRAYLGPKVAAFRLHISFPGTPALIEVSHGACATALSLLITPDELDDLCIHHDPLLGWRVLSERAQSPQSGLCDACTARLTAFATHSREEIWTHLAQPHPAAPTERQCRCFLFGRCRILTCCCSGNPNSDRHQHGS